MRVSGKPMSLVIDTNVWVDYFLNNELDRGASKCLLECAVKNDVSLLVCPTTLKDVFYLLPRRFKRQDALEGKPETSYEPVAWACIESMLELAAPSPLWLFECTLARSLRSKFRDYEDNLILASSESAKADYIVTRDGPLLQRFPEACITPEHAIELISQ